MDQKLNHHKKWAPRWFNWSAKIKTWDVTRSLLNGLVCFPFDLSNDDWCTIVENSSKLSSRSWVNFMFQLEQCDGTFDLCFSSTTRMRMNKSLARINVMLVFEIRSRCATCWQPWKSSCIETRKLPCVLFDTLVWNSCERVRLLASQEFKT